MNPAVRFWLSIFAAGAACVLTHCAPAAQPVTGDVCEASCARRAELGCLEPALAAQCLPVCQRAAARRMFDPLCVAQARDVEEMAACNVRCGR